VIKNTLLDNIVRYTNKYGLVHAKRWKDISRKDLESFFAVLFISGIQKRKDKPPIGESVEDEEGIERLEVI
jgi:hypothetical protein